MHVIVLAVALDQLSLEVAADLREHARQVGNRELRKSIAPIFGDKDQMGVKGVNDVSTLVYPYEFLRFRPCCQSLDQSV